MVPGPIIIGHRGASGYRPEHTLESYRLAIAQGADVIEPDLVMTRDGVLVVRHENEIGQTTDAAAKFPERRRSAVIDGAEFTGWFVEDFTLAEIKTLRARERLSFRPRDHDGLHQVPTFEEVIRFVQAEERRLDRRIGIYPETKHPSHHEALGLPITELLLATLDRFGYREPADPVFIQSFETANLRLARQRTGLRIVQLIDARGRPADFVGTGDVRGYADLITTAGLKGVAEYADGVGVAKELIQPIGADGQLEPSTALVAQAHRVGLFVHVWTLRADAEFLPAAYGGIAEREVRRFAELGVDGVFTDFPDVAARALGRTARSG